MKCDRGFSYLLNIFKRLARRARPDSSCYGTHFMQIAISHVAVGAVPSDVSWLPLSFQLLEGNLVKGDNRRPLVSLGSGTGAVQPYLCEYKNVFQQI